MHQLVLVLAAYVGASKLEDEAADAHALALGGAAGMHLRDEYASTERVAQPEPQRARPKLKPSGRHTRTGHRHSRHRSRRRTRHRSRHRSRRLSHRPQPGCPNRWHHWRGCSCVLESSLARLGKRDALTA